MYFLGMVVVHGKILCKDVQESEFEGQNMIDITSWNVYRTCQMFLFLGSSISSVISAFLARKRRNYFKTILKMFCSCCVCGKAHFAICQISAQTWTIVLTLRKQAFSDIASLETHWLAFCQINFKSLPRNTLKKKTDLYINPAVYILSVACN